MSRGDTPILLCSSPVDKLRRWRGMSDLVLRWSKVAGEKKRTVPTGPGPTVLILGNVLI